MRRSPGATSITPFVSGSSAGPPDGVARTFSSSSFTGAEPETKGVIEVAPGERRTAEIYFPIPDPATLPNTSLLEIDLAWTIDVEGRSITSHATFRRGSTYYSAPYYWDDPWYYGRPYYYGYGYGYGPYYGPYYYGPWWHGGFTFVHCD